MSRKLDYRYNPETDVLTIEGVHYSGALLRAMPFPKTDRLFRVLKNQDGLVTIKTYRVDMDAFEKWQKDHWPQ
jgi:hypothetical protein